MAYKNTVLPIPLATIAASTFTGSYQLLATLPHACIMLHLVNDTSVSVTVSYDGTNDHDLLLTGTDRPLNFQANANPQAYAASLAQGTKIYVKGNAGTGQFTISGFYQPIL